MDNKPLCALLSFLTLGILRFFVVPLGSFRFVLLYGKPVRYAESGLNRCLSLWGLYESPGPLIPSKEQFDDYKEEMVFTKDGVKCTIEVVVFYRITDAVKAVYEIGDYKTALKDLVQA